MPFDITTAKPVSGFNISSATPIKKGFDITTAKPIQPQIPEPPRLSDKLTEQGNWVGGGALRTGEDLWRGGIVKPVKTAYGGVLKSAANTADTADFYAGKIAQAMGKPETKDSVFKYLKDNWSTAGEQLQREGLSEGLIQKIYSGLGGAGFDIPKLMAMGPMGLTLSGILEGGKEGGVPGAVTGGIGGALWQKLFHGVAPLPTPIKKTALGLAGAVTTPGDLEEKIAGGATLAGLPSGKGQTMGEFKETQAKYGPMAYNKAKAVKEATKIYREMLRPTPGELRNIEIGKGENIDDYFKLAAEEGLLIEKGADNKLDTLKAKEQISEKQEMAEERLQEALKTNTAKAFSLKKLAEEAKRGVKKLNESAATYKEREAEINDYINAEIEARGGEEFVTGSDLNTIKRAMWKEGYNQGKPTKQSTARKVGYVAREMIEKGYSDQEIKNLNKKSGQYVTLQDLLGKPRGGGAHGRVVARGRIGQYAARATGGAVGAAIGSAIPIPGLGTAGGILVGQAAGKKVSDYLSSPERLSKIAINKSKKAGILGKNEIPEVNKVKSPAEILTELTTEQPVSKPIQKLIGYSPTTKTPNLGVMKEYSPEYLNALNSKIKSIADTLPILRKRGMVNEANTTERHLKQLLDLQLKLIQQQQGRDSAKSSVELLKKKINEPRSIGSAVEDFSSKGLRQLLIPVNQPITLKDISGQKKTITRKPGEDISITQIKGKYQVHDGDVVDVNKGVADKLMKQYGTFPKEGGGIDPASINWSKVNTFLRRKGYDVRGEDDVKNIYSRLTKDWTQNLTGDHLEALNYASTKKIQSEQTKVARYFGYTNDLNMAGYMTPEGKLLDFSGRKQGAYMPNSRQLDHREINQVLDYENNVELKEMLKGNEHSNSIGMRYFMNRGNIRMQNSGIDLSVEPTSKQWALIREHIKNNVGDSFYVDISDKHGNTVKSFSYEWPNVKVVNIVNDIDSYYAKLSSKEGGG